MDVPDSYIPDSFSTPIDGGYSRDLGFRFDKGIIKFAPQSMGIISDNYDVVRRATTQYSDNTDTSVSKNNISPNVHIFEGNYGFRPFGNIHLEGVVGLAIPINANNAKGEIYVKEGSNEMNIILFILVLFINTATASPISTEFKVDSQMDVVKHTTGSDAIVIGRFSGQMERFIFDGYDKNGVPKTRLLTTSFNALKERFGFPTAKWEVIVDEVLYIKPGLKINESITLGESSNFEDQNSKKNKKILKEKINNTFLFYLRRSEAFDAYELLTYQSLIKLNGKKLSALVANESYPILTISDSKGEMIKEPIIITKSDDLITTHQDKQALTWPYC